MNSFISFSQKLIQAFTVLFLTISTGFVFSQTATSVSLTGTTSAFIVSNNGYHIVDSNLVVSANGTITGFTVTITDNYASGDQLSAPSQLPSGVTVSSFNTTTHSLVFSGTTTAANWQIVLRGVKFKTTSSACSPQSRKISFVAGSAFYNPMNGHFYQQVTSTKYWTVANAYASTQSYFGLQGYLATISNQAENSFISVLLGQDCWMGCTDDYQFINAALGYTAYANQAASDGHYYWITGPERGTQISQQNAWQSGGTMPVSGIYSNWTSGEPNDWPNYTTSTPGEENYGHMYANTGKWNDYANNQSIGSIIEFGGLPNDNTSSQPVFTRGLIVSNGLSVTVNGSTTVCPGSNSTTLSLSSFSGSVVRWESSLDNFLTSPTALYSTSTSYTVTNISQTTYYRAIINTGSCTGISTSSAPIYVNITTPGTIVAQSSTICQGSTADLTLFGNDGSVLYWQVAANSNFSSGVTTINQTASSISYTLSTAGTFYFRAAVQNNGCTVVYSAAAPVTVNSGTPPNGGTLPDFDHCDSYNSGVLTLSGYTGSIQKWQYSENNGVNWTDINSVSTSQSYNNLVTTRQYRVLVTNNGCGFDYSSVGTITVYGSTVCKWLGGVSTDWADPVNWCGGVADNGKDVLVSSTAPNDLVLDQNRTIGNFDFNGTTRKVILGNNTLTASQFVGYSNTSYVQTNGTGKLKMNVSTGQSKFFPIANAAYNPVSVSNTTGNTDAFSVRVLNEVYQNGYSGTTFTSARIMRTWDISKANANAGSGVGFTFYWNAGENYGVTMPMLQHYNGTTWDSYYGSSSSTATSFTYNGYTGTFSPFAISNQGSALPVTLTDFTVDCSGENVELNWQTESEKNSAKFIVQRSEDGKNWSDLTEIAGAGNSTQVIDYSFTDTKPRAGVVYYRLKQVDFDGQFELFGPLAADCGVSATESMIAYPNPSNGHFSVNYTSLSETQASVVIESMSGQLVYSNEISLLNGSNLIAVSADSLQAGIYIVHVKHDDHLLSQKIVIINQ